VLAVEDPAVATSGEYERGAHIFDPRTGRDRRACSRSRSSDRTPGSPTPMRPRRSRSARTAPPGPPRWRATTRCASRATAAC
jgi:hypothetical protein